MVTLEITENDDNQRLDRFLKKYFKNAPLSRIYKMIRKDIKLNGRRAKEDTMLFAGDILTVYITQEENELLSRQRISGGARKQFRIAYEDQNILVAEKPCGLLVHGDAQEKKNTLANQVIDYLIEQGDYVPRREKTFVPSPVNRLDRNTSGLVLFGKNSQALRTLALMLREKGFVEKYYLTVVAGTLSQELTLSDYLVKDSEKNKVRILEQEEEAAQAKTICTVVRPLVAKGGYTMAEVELVTGRTHQIRAHLQKANYPIIGDEKYGNAAVNAKMRKEFGLTSQFLHACRLVFADAPPPLDYLTGTVVTAPLPDDLELLRAALFDENSGRRIRNKAETGGGRIENKAETGGRRIGNKTEIGNKGANRNKNRSKRRTPEHTAPKHG